MREDIWSDVVCPWCYVGQARFEKALSTFGHRDQVEGLGVSGAQPAQMFTSALNQAWERRGGRERWPGKT